MQFSCKYISNLRHVNMLIYLIHQRCNLILPWYIWTWVLMACVLIMVNLGHAKEWLTHSTAVKSNSLQCWIVFLYKGKSHNINWKWMYCFKLVQSLLDEDNNKNVYILFQFILWIRSLSPLSRHVCCLFNVIFAKKKTLMKSVEMEARVKIY